MNGCPTRQKWLSALILLPVMMVGCKSSDGVTDGDGDVSQPAPVVSISADPATVNSGDMSAVTWDATNADSCTASGAWSGDRPTNGTETVGPLAADSQFTLTCAGPGGSASRTAAVTVSGGAAMPTLAFSASPQVVAQGSAATLEWSTTDVDSCTASGDWSGPRETSGSVSTGNLNSNATYALDCSGPGGNVSDTLTVTVSASGAAAILGSVDSSLVNRAASGSVYLFAGTVTPDDIDGDGGDPMMSAVVEQDSGACTFSYETGSLAAGEYTLAFVADSASDNPQSDDVIDFVGTQTVTVSASPVVADFDPANVIRVGPGRTYQTVAAAASAAQDGDVVEIDAGVYPADVASWYQDNLTLRGVGGYAHLRADGADAQGKAIWVIAGNDTVVENIEFSQISVPDQNGAGIRHDGWNLVVCNGYFHDSEEGILGGAGDVLVEYSEFDNNGYGDGFSHNMYILDAERFTLRHSYMHHARIGHNVKSRARENFILYNRIMDESTGTSSYAVDIPNGGLSYVIGNLMQQGPNTDNSVIVNYGTEGLSGGRTHNLYLVNNTLVDDYGGTFVQVAGGTSVVELINNLLVGGGNILSGAQGTMTTNLQTTAPGLVAIDSFNYRLTGNSPAREAGSVPGMGNGFDLYPRFQYLHRNNRELRPADGSIDVGAYEFTP